MEVITFFEDLVWNKDIPPCIQFLLIYDVNVTYHRNKMTKLLRLGDRPSTIKFLRTIYISIFRRGLTLSTSLVGVLLKNLHGHLHSEHFPNYSIYKRWPLNGASLTFKLYKLPFASRYFKVPQFTLRV